MLPRLRWAVAVVVCAVLMGIFALAAKDFVAPRAFHAKTYPARDEHADENLTIAADPYDMADKAAIFTVHFSGEGFLPINLIVTNDGDQPIALTGMKIQLVTADRTKISPATEGDIRRRFTRTPSGGRVPGRGPLPIPLPGGKPKSGGNDAAREFNQASFMAKAVEPHSTQAGFLFFDVRRHFRSAGRGASLRDRGEGLQGKRDDVFRDPHGEVPELPAAGRVGDCATAHRESAATKTATLGYIAQRQYAHFGSSTLVT